MNQILSSSNNDNINNSDNNIQRKSIKKNLFFKVQFIFCSVIAVIAIGYYCYYIYDNNQKEQLSKKLISSYNITNLYDNQYNSIRTSTLNDNINNNSFSVIGIIEINTIGINYPIISQMSDEYLKIAPCRFYGPMPNEVGNMCIAGHNYNNYKFFSRLKKLNIGDIINIYDLSGNKMEYSVSNSYETDYNNLDCIDQNTNGKKEITLITCNNIQNKRRVIKAQELQK